MNIFIKSSAKCLRQTETIVTFMCVQQTAAFVREFHMTNNEKRGAKSWHFIRIVNTTWNISRKLKNTLLIEKQVTPTLSHLVTTVCEQEKENTDPDLFDFEVDFTIGL